MTTKIISQLEARAETYDELAEQEEDDDRHKSSDDEPIKSNVFEINAFFSDF